MRPITTVLLYFPHIFKLCSGLHLRKIVDELPQDTRINPWGTTTLVLGTVFPVGESSLAVSWRPQGLVRSLEITLREPWRGFSSCRICRAQAHNDRRAVNMYDVMFHPNYPHVYCTTGEHEHESTQVIVKFAYRYNPDAHRLLASRKFAPRLYFCERLPDVGGLWVVVMEYCTGRHITGPSSLSTHAPQLRAGLKLLHDQNLVFGDLRSANILIKEDKLLLIDFDWCGKAGKAQYPSDILLAEGKFHHDVQKGGLLQIEHDKYLFRQLTGEEL